MKNSLKICFFTSAIFFLIFTSCQKDTFINDIANSNSAINTQKINIKEGRLYFPSIETLKVKYDKIKDKKDIDIYNEMSKYYSEDFINLRPIITDKNEDKIYNQLIEREIVVEKILKQNNQINNTISNAAKSSTPQAVIPNGGSIIDNIDDLEDIIGDMAFASFLNGDAEVQVADNIYKYTDVGLFITKANSYNNMVTYLDQNSISKNLLVPTCDIQKQTYLTDVMPNGGLTDINSNLSYYRTPEPLGVISVQGCNSGGGGSSGGSSSGSGNGSSSGSSSTQTLENYIANLQPCNVNQDPFFGVFGKNKICIDRYESKKRVKTKAFDYNYLLVYHLGVKVKHQKKGWTGLWRQQDTDEVGIYVEHAQFKYDFTSIFGQELNSINQYQIFISPSINVLTQQTGIYEFSNTLPTFKFTYSPSSPYPFPVFQDDLVIEYFGNNNIIDAAIKIGNKQVTHTKLDEYFWKTVYAGTKSLIKSNINPTYKMPDNITFLSKHPAFGVVWIQKTYKKFSTNSSKVEKTFDFGASITITLNGENNYQLSKANIGSGDKSQQPKSYSVKMYGVAKANGQWHGSLLDF